jgi:hypothetical protein
MDHLLAHLGDVGAELGEHEVHDTVIVVHKPEEEVLGTDVVMAQRLSLAETRVQHLVGSTGEWRVVDSKPRRPAGQVLDLAARILK